MQIDYIIVGLGLAGLAFAEELEKHHKSFVFFEDHSQNASLVAAGVYNPIILKRFTSVWDAEDQLRIARPFYKALKDKLQTTFDKPIDIYRLFTSIEEQNNWFAASDKPFFSAYMLPEVINNTNKKIEAPFGLGRITNSGMVNTKKLLETYKTYLEKQDKIRYEKFKYKDLQIDIENVRYQDIRAKRVVFCEGFGLKKNLFFNGLPLNEAKGELLVIHAPDLKLEGILKSSVFIMPLGNDLYKVGATFNWDDKSLHPTEAGKNYLIDKLDKFLKADYKIVDHLAGMRPAAIDRRPFLGRHPEHMPLAILNGLGTRGVMLAPKMAGLLYNYLESDEPLPREVDIKRFD